MAAAHCCSLQRAVVTSGGNPAQRLFLPRRPATSRQQWQASAAAGARLRPQVACSAATEQGRESSQAGRGVAGGTGANGRGHSNVNGFSSSSSSDSGGDSGSSSDSLLQRIVECTSASQLHELLLCHAAGLRGPEVAAALEVAAKRKMLGAAGAENGMAAGVSGQQPGSGSAAAGSSSSAAALGAVLAHLAATHVRGMDPAALSTSAWALGALQLTAARPVMRTMHALAQQRLIEHSPSQLCSLLWAGGTLDPGFRSPLLASLADLLNKGMDLALFTPHDLAMLAWICGRDGGTVARDVLKRVVRECRARLQAYREAVDQLEGQAQTLACADNEAEGINWVQDTHANDAVPAMGLQMRSTAWKLMTAVIKRDLPAATAGEVLRELQLQLCGRPELNPVVSVLDNGRPVVQPLESYPTYHYTHKLTFRMLPRLEGLAVAAQGGKPPGANGSGASPLAALSRQQAAAVMQECAAAASFWEALIRRASQAKVAEGANSFSAVAHLASGRRLLLTWRRQGTKPLPVEVSELPSVAEPSAGDLQEAMQLQHEGNMQQEEHQQQQPQQQQWERQQEASLAPSLPPPPFGPKQAAMLLTGLASHQMRVEGVVEPLLQSCGTALKGAEVADVARILAALGQLQMEPALDRLGPLINRLASGRDKLSPDQMVAVMWAVAKVAKVLPRVVGIGSRHLASRLADYRAVDVVGMLWSCAQLNGVVPGDSLAAALRRLPPKELHKLSNTALCNLLWSLGKMMSMHCGHQERQTFGGRPGSLEAAEWLDSAAGVGCRAASLAAVAELAQRAQRMKPPDLAGAAVALAAHSPQLWEPPEQAAAAIKAACTSAAAASAYATSDLASLAISAAHLGWDDAPFVDLLASCLQARVAALLQPGEVARAMATLAPARHGHLFALLARSHVARTKVHTGCPLDLEERSAALAAFAVVSQAQGLPQEVLEALLHTVSATEVRRMPPAGIAALLELAAHVQCQRGSPLVQACNSALLSKAASMSHDQLRQARSALQRLGCSDPDAYNAIDTHLNTAGYLKKTKKAS